MRIKKTSPTTPANGNIENQYGTSQTNAYSEEYINDRFGGTTLYSGKSNTSITLNDNINNYSAIEIFYGNNGGSIFNSKKFLKGMYAGKLDYYNISTTTTAQNTQIFVKDISISGNTLSCGIDRALFITGDVADYSIATMTQGTDNLIYIYKVIGYK